MATSDRYSPQTDPFYQPGEPPKSDGLAADIIVSSDTRRSNRIPVGQSRTKKWPVLHAGRVPHVSTDRWSLTIDGLVERPLHFTWNDFQNLPRVKVFADFHCVTRWSRLSNLWGGVSTAEIAIRAGVSREAKFVLVGGYDDGWTTNLPLADFLSQEALFADRHDGEPLTADHGGPVRLIVPHLFAWKSAKWVKSVTFLADDQPGYWERLGYHDRGDPWINNDQHPDGERFRGAPTSARLRGGRL